MTTLILLVIWILLGLSLVFFGRDQYYLWVAEQKEANRRQMSVNNVVGVDKNEVSNMRS